MDKWEKDAYRRFGKRPRREHKKTSVCPSVWASNELKQRQKVSFQHHKMASHTTPPPHTYTHRQAFCITAPSSLAEQYRHCHQVPGLGQWTCMCWHLHGRGRLWCSERKRSQVNARCTHNTHNTQDTQHTHTQHNTHNTQNTQHTHTTHNTHNTKMVQAKARRQIICR